MLKLVDSHDLKSCGFSRPSSSLGEATLRSNIAEQVDTKYFVFSASTNKTKKNCIQSIYDNVYDMICYTQHEKKSSSSAINYKKTRFKMLAACGVPVRVWPRAPIKEKDSNYL